MQHCECTKCHSMAHFKMVILCCVNFVSIHFLKLKNSCNFFKKSQSLGIWNREVAQSEKDFRAKT